jgi:hypothetical protein
MLDKGYWPRLLQVNPHTLFIALTQSETASRANFQIGALIPVYSHIPTVRNPAGFGRSVTLCGDCFGWRGLF